MAHTDLHVNGPALVQVALNGSAYSNLGYTDDGVRATINTYHEDVMTDDYGSSIPGDVQFMGQDANISLPMVRWDAATMASVLGLIRNNSAGAHLQADIGTLLIAGSKFMGLRIQAIQRTGLTAEPVHTFAYAFPIQSAELSLSTRVSRINLTFRAIAVNGTLYSRA